MLASLASRHPGEATAGFTGGGPPAAGPEFYPTSPSFATASVQFAPPGTTLRVTSPGAAPAQLASVYPTALAAAATTTPQPSLLPMGPDRIPTGLGAAPGQTATQAIQLGDLFGSLRLGAGAAGTATPAAPYADFSPTEFGQAFAATLSQHGLLNVPGLGAYSVLTGSVPPVSSSGTMSMGGVEGPRPPVAMAPSRLIGTPAGLGVSIGESHLLFHPLCASVRRRFICIAESYGFTVFSGGYSHWVIGKSKYKLSINSFVQAKS